MKSLLKKIPLLVIGLVVGIGIIYSMQPMPQDVDVGKVTEGPLQISVDEDGITRVQKKYIIAAPLAGRLRRIPYKPGKQVEAKKTLLAVIEPTDPALLDDRARAEAMGRVEAAKAAVEQARTNQLQSDAALKQAMASEKQAQSEVAYTRAEHERIRKLFNKNRSASDQELNNAYFQMRRAEEIFNAAQFAVHAAKQSQESAKYAVKIAEHELAIAEAALSRTKEVSPGEKIERQFEIFSPVDGKVLIVHQESSTIVQPGKELLEVGNPTDLEVVVDVLSSDAVKIEPNDKVILEHWGGDYPLQGRVRVVEPQARLKISALGVEEQRVNVIIDLTDPVAKRKSLGDGFRVEARIVIWREEKVLKVPSGALFRHQGGWAVFVHEQEQAMLRPVKIGQNNGVDAQVLEGLQIDETVVLYPSDKIKDGVSIKPRAEQQ